MISAQVMGLLIDNHGLLLTANVIFSLNLLQPVTILIALTNMRFEIFYLVGFLSGFCDCANNMFNSILMSEFKKEQYEANSASLFLIGIGTIFFIVIGLFFGFPYVRSILIFFMILVIFAGLTANISLIGSHNPTILDNKV